MNEEIKLRKRPSERVSHFWCEQTSIQVKDQLADCLRDIANIATDYRGRPEDALDQLVELAAYCQDLRRSSYRHLLTLAVVPSKDGRHLGYGVAVSGLYSRDQPSRPRGRAIALGRAQLALWTFGEGDRDPGALVVDAPGLPVMRHAWVVRADDVDSKQLVLTLRVLTEATDSTPFALLEHLTTTLDEAVAYRLGG